MFTTGNHSKQDQTLLVKIGKYIGFVYTVGPINYGPPLVATSPRRFGITNHECRASRLNAMRAFTVILLLLLSTRLSEMDEY